MNPTVSHKRMESWEICESPTTQGTGSTSLCHPWPPEQHSVWGVSGSNTHFTFTAHSQSTPCDLKPGQPGHPRSQIWRAIWVKHAWEAPKPSEEWHSQPCVQQTTNGHLPVLWKAGLQETSTHPCSLRDSLQESIRMLIKKMWPMPPVEYYSALSRTC